MPNSFNSTTRFSDRVENYERYRPDYPSEVFRVLQREAGLISSHVVADIGCGTGISSKLFLDRGNIVYGIEPNEPMRAAAERMLGKNARFHSLAGTAEATRLPERSVDFVVVGQAFHWFDPVGTRAEFARILRPGGWVALVWNTRRCDTTAFLREYEQLIREFAIDYRQVDHRNIDDAKIQSFFAPAVCRYRRLDHAQKLDCAGLIGRLASSSYMPSQDHPRHSPMVEAAATLFARHAEFGQIEIEYDTQLYFGQFNAAPQESEQSS